MREDRPLGIRRWALPVLATCLLLTAATAGRAMANEPPPQPASSTFAGPQKQAAQRPARPSADGRRPVEEETGEFFREPTARDDLDQRLPVEFMPPPAERQEREPLAATADGSAATVLFDNGSLVDCVSCGAGGAGESQLRDLTSDRKTLGFGHQQSADGRIADDFTVDDPQGWTVRDIKLFSYQTGAATESTITSVDLQIWSGRPGLEESRVVWDGGEAHRLTESRWTGLYRVAESSSGETNRAILENVVAVNTTLEPGRYWLDWQLSGRLPSGPWAPTLAGKGNALHSIDDGALWQRAVDAGSGQAVDFPFVIEGARGVAGTGPAVNLVATLGPNCGDKTAVVNPGDDVCYGYTMSNTGDTTLTIHELVDDQLGVLLNAATFVLPPSYIAVHSELQRINVTTTNTATWTAYNPGLADIASDEDSATVFVSTARPLWCNRSPVSFEPGIPSDWTVVNRIAGSPVSWTIVSGCGEASNYADEGQAACASSDFQGGGSGVFDTDLISSSFSLAGVETASLRFYANYQRYLAQDLLDVDISTDNGSTWTTLARWDDDLGAFRALPGEFVYLDLTPFAGEPHLLLRWHYYDHDGSISQDDFYAQIDTVSLRCTLPAGGFHECRRPEAAIPDFDVDPSGLFDTLRLDSSLGTLHDLDVRLRVDHNWVGDLKGSLLTGPAVFPGRIVTLFDRPGAPAATSGCGNDDIDAVIDDEGTDGDVETMCRSTGPAILGGLVGGDPPNPIALAHFDGLDAGGEWVLNLQDQDTGITGTLEEWCLIGTACSGSVSNRLLRAPQTIEDCGTLTVGPNVRTTGELNEHVVLRAATAVVFIDGVSIHSALVVETDPSLTPP